MSRDQELMESIVDEASFDWIDFGQAIGVVAVVEGDGTDRALFPRTSALVVQLVRDGRLVPGEIGSKPGEFVPWQLDADAAARVLREYFDEVIAGTKPVEPWRPCLFAVAGYNDGPPGERP
jgi:hypothetical protein